MLTDQTLMDIACLQRRIYASLTEISELTDQLSQALSRQDQVSVRLFLSMRREELDHLLAHRAALNLQCAQLPGDDSAALQQLLSGNDGSVPDSPGKAALLRQVKMNRSLLERICQADQAVSLRLGGRRSFYSKNAENAKQRRT
ncbi:hypothetical protein [uncultured Pseudoflavonifractor sp.]|uniref:hypothetical protein n=1 Tax=uncultured Pseudoflavonifractor sp. TaxID=1221379 RepID=UPI0025CEC0C7|nr:hypothetical protein [uncultured Pseudoflavonifractor sp.]